MPKIVFIGGGSSKFIFALTRDLFSFPEIRNVTIGLMDIDEKRVKLTETLVKKMISELKINAKVEAGTDRRKILEGADYVIVTIMVGRFDSYAEDIDIPSKYGVYQAISDTIGPGGVFRLIRTLPVLHGIVKDMREVATSDVWILNYSNPMAMNVWGMLDVGFDKAVGLCHSVQGQYQNLGRAIGINPNEITYLAGGINHVNFYLRLEHNGRNIYPDILAAESKILDRWPSFKASFELLKYFGYFPAEAGYHQTEYYSYFRKNQKLIEEYNAPTKIGHKMDFDHAEKMAIDIPKMISGELSIDYKAGLEYGAYIIHSLETGIPRVFYGNVRNNSLIENHPTDAVVEIPCVADKTGIHPCKVGRIPEILAAVQRAHISVHELAVKGVINKDKKLIEQAIMVDPLTSAMCTLSQIRAMVSEMFEANKEYVEDW